MRGRPGDEANDVVMFSHFLGIILDHLDPVVPDVRVVELEWPYFALLRHSTRLPQRPSKALATYPEFFVQLLCLLYGHRQKALLGPPALAGVEKPSFMKLAPALLTAAPFIVSGAAKQRPARCAAALIITSCASALCRDVGRFGTLPRSGSVHADGNPARAGKRTLSGAVPKRLDDRQDFSIFGEQPRFTGLQVRA